jgi:hypothetical protein
MPGSPRGRRVEWFVPDPVPDELCRRRDGGHGRRPAEGGAGGTRRHGSCATIRGGAFSSGRRVVSWRCQDTTSVGRAGPEADPSTRNMLALAQQLRSGGRVLNRVGETWTPPPRWSSRSWPPRTKWSRRADVNASPTRSPNGELPARTSAEGARASSTPRSAAPSGRSRAGSRPPRCHGTPGCPGRPSTDGPEDCPWPVFKRACPREECACLHAQRIHAASAPSRIVRSHRGWVRPEDLPSPLERHPCPVVRDVGGRREVHPAGTACLQVGAYESGAGFP